MSAPSPTRARARTTTSAGEAAPRAVCRPSARSRESAADAALDATLSALAEPTRRRVVHLLRDGPRRASDIAEALGTSRQAMSRHLRVLREAGLIQPQADAADDDDGRARVYTLDARPLAPLHDWLSDVQAFWDGQLAAFKAHAEARHGRR